MTKAARARQSTQQYRARMRAKGMRLVQLWVPDTNAPGFASEARRQSRSLLKGKAAKEERKVMEWLEAVTDTEGWT